MVSKSYSSEISLLELSILIELQIERGRSLAALAKLFRVDPQIVFRAAENLESRKFLSKFDGIGDARVKNLQLTKLGINELNSIDKEANDILDQMLVDFSKKSLNRFISLLGVMEEFFCDERATIRSAGDHPLRGPIRTFTRGFGLLGNSAFGVSSISTFDWHILTALDRSVKSTYASDLSARFHSPSNSISVLLLRFEKKGYLRRITSDNGDKRLKAIELTKNGRALLQGIEETAVELIKSSMNPLTNDQVLELCSLMEDFVGVRLGEFSLSIPFYIKPLINKDGIADGAGVYLSNEFIGKLRNERDKIVSESRLIEFLTKRLK